jgi:hypothetical protein
MKKQTLIRAFLMAILLVGAFAVTGNGIYAQDGGTLGSGVGRGGYIGSGVGRASVSIDSGSRDGGATGSGSFSDGGGAIGSGTLREDDGGLIGSGVGRQKEASFFYTMMEFFGF